MLVAGAPAGLRRPRQQGVSPIRARRLRGSRDRAAARRGRRLGLLLLSLGLLAPGGAVAADYADGLAAFQAGDYAKAHEVWQALAGQGEAAAQYGLGVLYEQGLGAVDQDEARAVQWYERAVEQGVAAAQNNLGLMYAQGRGVERDAGRAAELWRQAAEQGHAMAQYNLGLALYRGAGVEQDAAAAARWFRRAGEAGLADAQYGLGQMYRLGVAVGQDDATALAWYRRAAEQGHERAQQQARALAEAGVEPAALPRQGAASEQPQAAERGRQATPAAMPTAAEQARAMPKASAEEAGPDEQVAAAPAGTPPVADDARGVHVWLGSTEGRAAAERRWSTLRERAPRVLGGVRPVLLRLGDGERARHRVLAGPFDSREGARDLCARLRQAAPGAFCRVLYLQG